MTGRLLVVSLITLAAPAHAQPVAMIDSARTFAWHAPADCPDATSLRTRIEQRLERPLEDVGAGVEVDVVLTAGRYVARVDLRAVTVANDIRTLTSKRCSELADAVAVIVARVASEQHARRRVAVRDEPDEVTAHVTTVPATPPPSRAWSFGARASVVSGIGLIPQVGLGGEVALTLRRHALLVELAGTRWATSVHDGTASRVDVDLDTVSARVGWRPPALPLRAWLAVEAGSMRGNPGEEPEAGRWLAAGAGFSVAWQMKPWLRLLATTETMLAVERARFSLGGGVIVYAPSPMSFRTSVGLEFGWQ